MVMKRSMRGWLFALVLFSQQGKAAMVQEPTPKYDGIVILTHGMGAEVEKFRWYAESEYVKTVERNAHQAGLDYKFVPWFDAYNQGGVFAGLHPADRLIGGLVLAKEILNAARTYPNGRIILVGHSLGGQVLRCACNLIDPTRELIGLERSLLQELGIFAEAVAELAIDFVPEGQKVKRLLGNTWGVAEKIAEKFDAKYKGLGTFKYFLEFIKEGVTQEYLQEITLEWKKAFDETQKYKQQLFGNTPIHKNLINELITIGTPNDGLAVFGYNQNVIGHYINYYSCGDFIAPLIGKRYVAAQDTIADISVYFEIVSPVCCCYRSTVMVPSESRKYDNYSPRHVDLIGNVQMAPWLLSVPERLGIGYDKFFGRETTVSFFNDQTKIPYLSYNQGNKPACPYCYNPCC